MAAMLRSLPSLLPRPPVLDQRARDVLGLGLVSAGVFMGFVLYGGWNGGQAGHGVAVAFGWTLGRTRAFVPVALVLAGGVLLLRTVFPTLRSLRAGVVCLFAAGTLALAANTLGVSSAADGKGAPWTSAFLQAHGGVVGEALYQLAHRLVQTVGVDILVVFLVLAGVVLLTGTSLASAIRAAGQGLIAATRLLRNQINRLSAVWRGRKRQPAAGEAGGQELGAGGGAYPPETAPEQLVVRATHVEAPSQDGRAQPSSEPSGVDAPLGGHGAERPAWGSAHEVMPPVAGETAAGRRGSRRPPAASDPEQPGEQAIAGMASADASGVAPAAKTRPGGEVPAIEDPGFTWKLPDPGKLLTSSSAEQRRPDAAGQERIATGLVEALGHFGVQAKVIGRVVGPHITRYELRLAPGTKVAKVAQLKDDLAYALAATDIRILAPIPGKQAVGVEVPNSDRRIVRLGDVFQEPPRDWSPLSVWLGKDVAGKAIGADLAKMPHLLVAGTTGSGKSGTINAMLSSILLRATPHEVRLVLVDPKQVELNHYESIPHLLTPVITSPRMAANALQNLVKEMEQRYGIMSLARTRSLTELNRARAARGEAPLPYVLCVIDELADLMMVAPADVEDSIIRLAQKARAVGIHLVLATQSPRVDVITGMIKANVPSRIAFSVSSQIDSRVILDQNGAESLLGQGDMLFSPVGTSRLQRIQGAYIDEPQIARLTDLWRRQGEPELHEELLDEVESEPREDTGEELDPDEDPLLRDAITLVAEMQTASTSMLQRRLRLGYTRAGRVIDMLERRGVISGYEGSKPRQVLINEADLPRVLAALDERAPAASD
jgi:S-DNA-T family DNA segregation ATPase FtsK/SpoIIIE